MCFDCDQIIFCITDKLLFDTNWSLQSIILKHPNHFSNIFESFFEYFLNHHDDNFTFTNHFYILGSIFAVNVWIACIPVKHVDWLSQDKWMDWVCLLRRTGLHPTPMDNRSVTCTHFAESNQIRTCMYLWYVYACACRCDLPWAYDQELGINNYSVRKSLCLSILDEFVGAVENHAQHCTWLWPPSQ